MVVLLVIFVTMAVVGTALAAIVFGSYGTDQNGSGATTLTIDKPSGVAAKDLLLAQITFHSGLNITVNPPSGWVLVLRTNRETDIGQAIYYRIATADDVAATSYSWGISPSEKAAGAILRYTDVRPVDPVNVSAGSSGESNPLTAPSVTTTEANTLLVTFFGVKKTTTLTVPSGMTARYTGNYFQNPQDVTVLVADVARPSSGATGARTSSAGSVDKWVAQSVALREASPAAVTLAAFEAQARADGVTLAWETVSETDNAGFNIYRSDAPDGEPALLAFVPSQVPGSSQGAAYTWIDAEVAAGATYWYTLEDVELSGATTRHAPVEVTVGAPNAVGLAAFSGAVASASALAGLAGLATLALAGAASARLRRREH